MKFTYLLGENSCIMAGGVQLKVPHTASNSKNVVAKAPSAV